MSDTEKIVELYSQYKIDKPNNGKGVLHIYGDNSCLPMALIMPGGAYSYVSEGEWTRVVDEFLKRGYNAAVLDYSVAPTRHPAQLTEACMAMDYLYGISDKVYVIGFSAAGHLSLMLASLHGNFSQFKAKPMAVCAMYPVVSSKFMLKHKQSFENLCGADKALAKQLSCEKLVSENTCPICIFHAKDDLGVLYRNSIVMAESLKSWGIRHSLTIYPKGGHGFSVGNPKYVNTSGWIDDAIKFFEKEQ